MTLIRHGPYQTQAEARAIMNADPRPQFWLAAQGAYIYGRLGRDEWWAVIPERERPECPS